MAEMHQHHKEEAERMAAAMQAKLADMETALGSVEAQKKELENATKKQVLYCTALCPPPHATALVCCLTWLG